MYTAVISGASRGIGFAIASEMAKQGWNLAIYSKNLGSLENAKSKLLSLGAPKVLAIQTDASIKSEVLAFADAVKSEFPTLDVLVNNAGFFVPGNIATETDEVFENLMQTNVNSAYYLSKYLIPTLEKSKRAHIFNIGSIAGLEAYPSGGSYSISKFAITGLSRALRKELMPLKIRVSNISPGATLTDSWAGVDLPESRFIDPNDIGKIIMNLFEINLNTVVEEIILRPVEGDL